MRDFKDKFYALSNEFQVDLQNGVKTHLDVIRGTLDILRSENVAQESEQNPEFRSNVEARIDSARDEIKGIQAIVG